MLGTLVSLMGTFECDETLTDIADYIAEKASKLVETTEEDK